MGFHAKDLRLGRYSQKGQVYSITTVTHLRNKIFLDFYHGRLLINVLRESDRIGQSATIGFVVMPDHLHWLFTLTGSNDLSQTVQYVKGASAYKINKYKHSSDKVWQSGFHDHCLRRDEDLISTMRYIIANPLRAGIVHSVSNYPHWDCIYL